MNSTVNISRFRFGAFEIDLRERELRKFGLRVRLQQKPFQVLERLLRTPGEFVGRDELATLLWPGLHVAFDRSLNTAVNAVRRALGDQGRNPRFIETRTGLGYVFIAAIEPVEQSAHPANGHRENVEAYQEYLTGRFFADKMTEADIRKSVAYFESAIERDPKHALAYTGLVDSWLLFAQYGTHRPEECFARARDCAHTALRINDRLAETHTAFASVRQFADRDWAGASKSYQRSLSLNPNNAAAHAHYARHLCALGRFEEALTEIGAALEQEPISMIVNLDVAWIQLLSRDYQKAAEQSWRILAMEPRFAAAQLTLGRAYEQLGLWDEAIVELNNARVCSEDHPATVAALAHCHAVAGRRSEAEPLLADLRRISTERYVAPYWFSVVYTGLEEYDLAFEALDQGVAEHDIWLSWLNVDPRFDRLRRRSRFEEILSKTGLLEAPRAVGASH